jgi:acyl phosphate:glycerol-3-phosphate acyltransferase
MTAPSLLSVCMIIFAYLCGSLCSAIIVAKIFDLPDPRSEGSKNPGATNVLRLSGKKYAAIVMAGDVLKGFLPVILAKLFSINDYTLAVMCLAAVLGHMFPIFFRFKGGKGVATALGAIFALQFVLGVLVALTWLAVLRATRYSSLASMTSMLLMPLYSFYTIESILFVTPLSLITMFILYKHRDNILRLSDGTESKVNFNFKKKPAPEEKN